MKKLALTIGCAAVVTGTAFAQGTLNWATMAPTGITVQQNATLSPFFGGSTSVSGTFVGTTANSFYFELLYNTSFTGSAIAAPSLAALTSSAWIDSGLKANNSTASAGKITPVVSSLQAVAAGSWVGGIGALGGTTNNIVLVGWSSNLGSTWAAVAPLLQSWDNSIPNAYFGVSNTGYIVPNISPANGPNLFGNGVTVNGLPINSVNTQLYLLPVPEPATFALAGLGGLAMLMFRRRK